MFDKNNTLTTYVNLAAAAFYASAVGSGASDALLIYWLASICLMLEMTHREARHASIREANSVLVQSAYIAAALVCFILEITTKPLHVELPCDCDDSLNCMEARERYKPKPHIFSRLVYMWVTPAIDNGRLQNRYREDDLFRVPRNISGQQANIEFLADWDTFGATNQQSLLSLLVKHTSRDILVSGVYMALSATAQLLQPLMLKKTIEFFREYGHKDGVAFDEGLMLAMGMGFLGLVRAISYQAHWHVLMKPYLWLEKVLAALVFRKTLRLSNESRVTHSTGEIASYLGLIFVSLSLFMLLEEPLSQTPTVVSVFINAARSYYRICKLVTSYEIDQNAIIREPYDRDAPGTGSSDVLVKVEDGSFKWLSTQEPTLTNVNLQCQREELVAVIGKVGAGKSSLVSAMLGDMIKCTGQVTIRGRVAYVPQQAWIVNATLRDNILFGNRFDRELYDRVIDACALRQDLEMLPGGDMTEIGEKGINLSGGQKARVSLARAVYSRADVYILDDPLAAVDTHVGKHIFTQVLGPHGMLRTRARILVTNAVQYLNNVNHIIMLHDGAVLAEGDPAAIFSNGSCMRELLDCGLDLDSRQRCADDQSVLDSSTMVANEGSRFQATKTNDKTNGTAAVIMQKERLDVGAVSKDSIKFYLQASGYGNIAMLICAAVVTLILNTSSGMWLGHWSQTIMYQHVLN
ncbi:hypothetical protein IWW42_005359 [Coemansia sp. RSA 1085]|nr:hypothetical protein IWW42_005359 [Coemansia sp. RSA 1085]